MQYRHLGRAGIKVSELILGSWLPQDGARGGDPSILACTRRAFDLGINAFDTADIYHNGHSEQLLGEAIRELPRHEIVIATKCGNGTSPGPNGRGLSRKHMREACDGSLRRLGVDYIDLYQAHSFDSETPLAEVCRGFDDLVRAGKVLYWGVSNWTGTQIQEACALCDAHGYDRPVSQQPRYSMLFRNTEKDELPVCAQWGLGVVAYSPLAQGLLTGKYQAGIPAGSRGARVAAFSRFLAPYNLQAVSELQAIASGAGLTLAQLALAWVLRLPTVAAAIVGATQPEQLEENAKACGRRLSDELLADIQQALDRRWAQVLEDDARALRAATGKKSGTQGG
jgi:aryl-alcohol dehydrogenase-like predicted oxidoreductase